MTKRMTGIGLAITVALASWTVPAHGQRGRAPALQAGPNMGSSLELALENQAELELTGDQLAQLQELKAVLDGDVLPLAEEMKALRDQVRTGDVPRDEGFRSMEALRGELITAAAPLRGRVQEILTVAQHRRLQIMVRQARPGAGLGRGLGRVGAGRSGVAPMRGRMNPRGLRGGVGVRGVQRPMRPIRGRTFPRGRVGGWGSEQLPPSGDTRPLPPDGGEHRFPVGF